MNEALNLDFGARIDAPEGHGDRFSPQLGLSYFSRPINTSFRVDAATAFKLPSFFALGNPIVGNSSLKPETSKSLSLSALTDFFNGKFEVESSIYISEYKNLIDFSPGPPPQRPWTSPARKAGIRSSG